jgi:predicted AlkP superfamily pyrophosphatase or phosphodiesterase
MARNKNPFTRRISTIIFLLGLIAAFLPMASAQERPPHARAADAFTKPKLVVVIVVDQMRADYIDEFGFQWTGGLKRLITEGAWFRNAAFPYAITTTCAGHATISTGALPATHGMISNEWWDRERHKEVACTDDSNAKNVGYAEATVKGGNSAANLLLPAFADELKFQSGPGVRVVSFSLKPRSAITLGGRTGDAVTWFDGSVGAWVTSSAYPVAKFVEEYAKAHPVSGDYGKTWAPLLPSSAYLYPETAIGAVPPPGFGPALPHPLRGMPNSTGPDRVFYDQWEGSPYADTYLSRFAEAAVDRLELGKRAGTDFLAVGFSPVDHAGHAFGPRSWEIQDILARLDRDLTEFFSHLDRAVGKGNYVVAFSSDHGVGPTPEDLLKSGMDNGLLNVYKLQEQIEKALEPFHFPTPAVSEIGRTGVYFTPGTYDKLKAEPEAWRAVLRTMLSLPGVAAVYRAEELDNRASTLSPMGIVQANSFFLSRSGDLTLVLKPYWILDYTKPGKPRDYGATHGGPYAYDQRVPVLFMGYGIQPGEHFQAVTPADIAPTLAVLCGITMVAPDGHVLAEALKTPTPAVAPPRNSVPGRLSKPASSKKP